MIKNLCLSVLICGALYSSSCQKCNSGNNNGTDTTSTITPEVKVSPPKFDADTAFYLVRQQVAMGPRAMNFKVHDDCGRWIIEVAKKYADTVYVQPFEAKGWDGKTLKGTNIIASFNPSATKRILISTHWDSRPWADQDTKDQAQPILAANDAASGVGVMLELARAIRSQPNYVGVDLFFNDAEDYGKSEGGEDSYCLGVQYWGKHLHVPGYHADFGILLDMVGARNSVFAREVYSSSTAGWVQDLVWENAKRAGYSGFFTDQQMGPITDDHVYINRLTGIPTIDIIHHDPNSRSGTFGDYWHTHADNMDIIDKGTLRAVGETLLYTIYRYDAEQKVQ
ncbi:MAG: M28 family peptidase [Chitinophagales bacterium]